MRKLILRCDPVILSVGWVARKLLGKNRREAYPSNRVYVTNGGRYDVNPHKPAIYGTSIGLVP